LSIALILPLSLWSVLLRGWGRWWRRILIMVLILILTAVVLLLLIVLRRRSVGVHEFLACDDAIFVGVESLKELIDT
jgi:hypothetical protein